MEKFYNRKTDLNFLEEKYQKLKNGELIVVYGRRRLGKTSLAEKFIEKKPNALYFYVDLLQQNDLYLAFAQQIEKQTGEKIEIKTWADFYEFLDSYATKHSPAIVIIDEFQRTKTSSPSFISQLQHHWDSKLKNKPLFLFLVGSSIGMIRRIAFSSAGALYGRRTGQIKLAPFKYADFRQAFSHLPEKEKVEWFSVFGGTPYYLDQAQKHDDLWNAIHDEILLKDASLREEPTDLLEFELRSITRYNSIMRAIASGKQTNKEISDATGIAAEVLPSYLYNLEELLGLVQKRDPLLGKKRAGRYKLSDYFFRFWYRFVMSNSQPLEIGKEKEVLEQIRHDLPSFVGPVFEDIARELFIAYNGKNIEGLELDFSQIGPWWNKQGEEIDVVIDSKRELVLVEVKWTNQLTDADVLENLMRKSPFIDKPGPRRFVLVSKSGFTEKCKQLAEKHHAVLLDLADVQRLYDEITPTK